MNLENMEIPDLVTIDQIDSSDTLRGPERVLQPDGRMENFATFDGETVRKVTLNGRYDAIARFELNATTPLSVRVHFETAKNLYLYGWFVYRFIPVAEQQALASLEFALREHLASHADIGTKKHKPKGLSDLLRRAASEGRIRNESFPHRRQWANEMARDRFRFAMFRELMDSGRDEIEFDDSHVQPTADDLAHDWIGDLIDSLPKIRNTYAHGSGMLYPNVLRTFEIVGDLINQLYPVQE